MELAPVPRRRRSWSWRVRVTAAVLVLAPATLLVVVPAASGLERYVMNERVADAAPRGSVVLARPVPLGDLRKGDVVTFSPAGTSGLVSGAVLRVKGPRTVVEVAGDRVPIADRTSVSRSVMAVPFVGYPFVGGVFTPELALLALGVGLLLVVHWLRASRRAAAYRPAAHRTYPRTVG